ncbi:MAG: hypothetical protein IT233_00735 [Bacteroidia bacterium]|nr:hypothetical protein [Bacteroidia bacterium]
MNNRIYIFSYYSIARISATVLLFLAVLNAFGQKPSTISFAFRLYDNDGSLIDNKQLCNGKIYIDNPKGGFISPCDPNSMSTYIPSTKYFLIDIIALQPPYAIILIKEQDTMAISFTKRGDFICDSLTIHAGLYSYDSICTDVDKIKFNSGERTFCKITTLSKSDSNQLQVSSGNPLKTRVNHSAKIEEDPDSISNEEIIFDTTDTGHLNKKTKERRLLFKRRGYDVIITTEYYSTGKTKSKHWHYYQIIESTGEKGKLQRAYKQKTYYASGKKASHINWIRHKQKTWDENGKRTEIYNREIVPYNQ